MTIPAVAARKAKKITAPIQSRTVVSSSRYDMAQNHTRKFVDTGGFGLDALEAALPRFWRFINKTDDCWLWAGGRDWDGYGLFKVARKSWRVHRYSYTVFVGPIGEGLHIDHLCRVRACVNPQHLEPVTPKENTLRSYNPAAMNARKTHCKRGHPLTPDNLCRWGVARGARQCRTCENMRHGEEREAWEATKGGSSIAPGVTA